MRCVAGVCLCGMENLKLSREAPVPWLLLGPEWPVFCVSCTPGRQAYELGAGGAGKLPGTSPVKTRPSGGRGCIFVAFILFFLLSPCLQAWSLLVLINVCSLTHTLTVSLSLARLCAAHTNTHTQSQAHWAQTPVVSLLCMAHGPFATNPCPFHTKLPVGKTHNFYTTQS